MKFLDISRNAETGAVSYKTRGLDTVQERELAVQQDCIGFIDAIIPTFDSKKDAERVAGMIMQTCAAVHSDIERILRQHGKKETVA
jgi:hypothetical protein